MQIMLSAKTSTAEPQRLAYEHVYGVQLIDAQCGNCHLCLMAISICYAGLLHHVSVQSQLTDLWGLLIVCSCSGILMSRSCKMIGFRRPVSCFYTTTMYSAVPHTLEAHYCLSEESAWVILIRPVFQYSSTAAT